MRLHRLAAALVLTLLVLAACTSPSDPEPDDPGGIEGTNVPRIEDPELPSELVPTLQVVQDSDEGLRIFTQHYQIPGADDLNSEIEAYVQEARDAYTPVAENAIEAGDEQNLPDLNVQSTIMASSPELLAIRMTTYQFDMDTDSQRMQTYWYDGERLLESADLFADDAAFEEFGQSVLQEMDEMGYAPSNPDEDPRPQLGSITFEDGDPVAEVAAGALTAAAGGSFTITVPAGDLLSDVGERAAGAVDDPQTFEAAPDLGSDETAEEPTEEPTSVPPSGEVDCTQTDCVAITYDDGPSAELTPQLLDTLARLQAPATFFLLGSNVEANPEIARRIVEDGHEVANHTWTHRDMVNLDADARAAELQDTNAAIEEATGVRPTLMRPPYGSANDEVVTESDMVVVQWDVDSEDWSNRDAQTTTANVLDAVEPGSIVLLHDIHPSTIESAPDIIEGLRDAGYTLVTVSDILRAHDPQPGSEYRSGRP